MIRGDDLCRCQHYRDGHAHNGLGHCAAPCCRCARFVFREASVVVVPGRLRGRVSKKKRKRVTMSSDAAFDAYTARLASYSGSHSPPGHTSARTSCRLPAGVTTGAT